MTIRAVCFDVGNTLIFPHPSVSEVCRQVLAEEGHIHDLSAIDALMPLVDEYYEDRYRSDDTFWTDEDETSQVWVGMYSLLCRRLGIAEQPERIARRVYDEFGRPDRWSAYEDVAPAFARLNARGVAVAIVSNWDRRLPRLLEGLGLTDSIDTIVCSAEVGLRKPDPRIFELALERLGAVAADTAHVGDHHYADILGATAVGMVPVLIDRHNVVGGASASSGRFLTTLDHLEAVLGMEEWR